MTRFITPLLILLLVAPAAAQERKRRDRPARQAQATPAGERADDAGDARAGGPQKGSQKKGDKVQVFDFTGIDIGGRLRTPQLLYFLDRAAEELERASLERRTFIPEMVRSIEEEAL